MRHSSPQLLERRRMQVERRLPMRAEIWRPMPGAPTAPGYPPVMTPTKYLEEVPCYVHNLLYLLQGEFPFPEREYASGQMRGQLPFGYKDLISEQDDIRNITLHGEMLWAQPLNIYLVIPHSIYTLLVLRGN